ncbi:DoxX family protein [Diaminobutyricibacter sp. McL0618]|uniref:DoxX family protein n=1 Tax=Leifsonia sp. McL0618 TaxID=3415677 RepID=UPI003CEA387A
MLIVLWILLAILALFFVAAGATKLVRSRTALASSGMAWADDYSAPMVKLIGAVEVVGAFGLVLPLLTGVAPVLTPIAAIGLAVVMIGAAVTHARRKESAVLQIVVAVLCVAAAILAFALI